MAVASARFPSRRPFSTLPSTQPFSETPRGRRPTPLTSPRPALPGTPCGPHADAAVPWKKLLLAQQPRFVLRPRPTTSPALAQASSARPATVVAAWSRLPIRWPLAPFRAPPHVCPGNFRISRKNPPKTVSRQPEPQRGSGWRETVPPFTPSPTPGPRGAAGLAHGHQRCLFPTHLERALSRRG